MFSCPSLNKDDIAKEQLLFAVAVGIELVKSPRKGACWASFLPFVMYNVSYWGSPLAVVRLLFDSKLCCRSLSGVLFLDEPTSGACRPFKLSFFLLGPCCAGHVCQETRLHFWWLA
jgi:hypothetical protein